MKILIIVPGFPLNLEKIHGGVNTALSNLLSGFANIEVEIRVVSFNREISESIVSNYAKNITIIYLPEGNFPHAINFFFKGSSLIKHQIREFNPTVVHFAMSGYILLTKAFGLLHKKALVTIHGIPFSEARQKELFKEKLVWYSNGIVEWLLCPSNIIHLSNYSILLYGVKNKKNITLIPNAVSSSYFDLPFKNNTNNRLLYAGNIDANKNILFLLSTLKVLIQRQLFFTLAVLGDFTDKKYKVEVLSFIKSNNLEMHITFYGWVSQKIVQEVLTESDILVVSSKQETLPMVIAEAMSAGKVVVASSVGGIPEMIAHGVDGFLFDTSTIENILPILELLYNNNTLIQFIQQRAKQKAWNTYHCANVALKTKDFYQQLLSQS